MLQDIANYIPRNSKSFFYSIGIQLIISRKDEHCMTKIQRIVFFLLSLVYEGEKQILFTCQNALWALENNLEIIFFHLLLPFDTVLFPLKCMLFVATSLNPDTCAPMDEELQFVRGCSYNSFRGPNSNSFIR